MNIKGQISYNITFYHMDATCIICGAVLDRGAMIAFTKKPDSRHLWIESLTGNEEEYRRLENKLNHTPRRSHMLCRMHFETDDFTSIQNCLIRGRVPTIRCWDDNISEENKKALMEGPRKKSTTSPIDLEQIPDNGLPLSIPFDLSKMKKESSQGVDYDLIIVPIGKEPLATTSIADIVNIQHSNAIKKKKTYKCFICGCSREQRGNARQMSKKRLNHSLLCAGAVLLGYFSLEEARNLFERSVTVTGKYCFEHARDMMMNLLIRFENGHYDYIRKLLLSITAGTRLAVPSLHPLTLYAENELAIILMAHPRLKTFSTVMQADSSSGDRAASPLSELPPILEQEYQACLARILEKYKNGGDVHYELIDDVPLESVGPGPSCISPLTLTPTQTTNDKSRGLFCEVKSEPVDEMEDTPADFPATNCGDLQKQDIKLEEGTSPEPIDSNCVGQDEEELSPCMKSTCRCCKAWLRKTKN